MLEQIIRPTGLVDPKSGPSARSRGRSTTCLQEIRVRGARGASGLSSRRSQKRWRKDLTDYLLDVGVRVRYLHSEIESLERIEILRDLRLGRF